MEEIINSWKKIAQSIDLLVYDAMSVSTYSR